MALYDAATLLERLRFYLARPDADETYTDAQLYALLSDAQAMVYAEVAGKFPRVLMGAPELLTTADGGLTYRLASTDADGDPVWPMGHAEVYARLGTGGELYGSTYASGEGDVVFEGGTIRLPRAVARSFSDGPYVRYVPTPGAISASSQPTLQPKDARMLIVFRALVLAQARGGFRDTAWAEELYRTLWQGDPKTGDVGLQGRGATQYAGQRAPGRAGVHWWRGWRSTLGLPTQRGIA